MWTLPNLLSMVRLAGVPVFLWLVLGPEADGWALVLLMVSGITDFLDGWLARKLNQTSVVGQILDPVADRLYILAVVVGLALREIIPWWVAISLPLRDLLLWGLVPLLRTRGYSALPVHFLGKAATFNLLYAFPLLLLGDGEGMVATLAEVFGWAFAIWGIGLYWWAGVLYAWQVRKLLADDRAPGCGARCLSARPRAPAAGARHHAAADPDHPAVPGRGLPARRRRRATQAPRPPRGRSAPRRRRVVVAVFGLLVTTRPCRPPATPASTTRAGPRWSSRSPPSATACREPAGPDRRGCASATWGCRASSARLTSTAQPRRADAPARDAHRLRAGVGARACGSPWTTPPTATRRQAVRDEDLALLVDGLWSAGAEAIAINGQRLTDAVRDPQRRPGDPHQRPAAGAAVHRAGHRGHPARCRPTCSTAPTGARSTVLPASSQFVSSWATRTRMNLPAGPRPAAAPAPRDAGTAAEQDDRIDEEMTP